MTNDIIVGQSTIRGLNPIKVEVPKDIKKALEQPIPAFLIKQRPGGGRTLSYISGSTVIGMLNNIFGYMWDWEVEREWVQESQPRVYKEKATPQGPVAHVRGTLTVYVPGENGETITIKKSGYGSKAIIGGQADQESIFKAAGTDALKKAASMIGIGLPLYRDDEEQLYFDEINNEDAWTEKAICDNQENLAYVAQFREKFGIDDSAISNIIMQFSSNALSGVEDIIPSNVEAFATYLKELERESDKQAESEKHGDL